jgi:hypothetical protein
MGRVADRALRPAGGLLGRAATFTASPSTRGLLAIADRPGDGDTRVVDRSASRTARCADIRVHSRARARRDRERGALGLLGMVDVVVADRADAATTASPMPPPDRPLFVRISAAMRSHRPRMFSWSSSGPSRWRAR